MNSGQTMMVIAAMGLLSMLTLSINSSIVNASLFGFNMEVQLDAISYAQSMLDEILFNDFDEKTTNGVRAFDYEDITSAASLGKEAGETISGGVDIEDQQKKNDFQSRTAFDDIDDYNGYQRKAYNTRLGWFDLNVDVKYVNESTPDIESSTPTFYKRVTVTITHPNMITDSENKIIPLVMKDLSIYRRYF
jgi:hypothetical protein